MLMQRITRWIAAVFTIAVLSAATAGEPLTVKEMIGLHSVIMPHADEAEWATVPWMPAGDIWSARKKAADEDKPILLWYMAGEPLGTC